MDGCGTGLELDEIFKLIPHVSVTGIDAVPVRMDADSLFN
nr:class I SAM-dependent methyltransferase [Anaeromicropila populeti]